MKTAKAPSTLDLASEDPKPERAIHQNGEVTVFVAQNNDKGTNTTTPASPAKSVHDELGLDEATKRELRLDLGGIEGSIDAAEVLLLNYSVFRILRHFWGLVKMPCTRLSYLPTDIRFRKLSY